MRHHLKLFILFLLTIVCLWLVYSLLTNCFSYDGILISDNNYNRQYLGNKLPFKDDKFSNKAYHIWCVFTKHKTGGRSMENKFRNMLVSLINTTNAKLHLNIIVDTTSRYVAKDIIAQAQHITKKKVEESYNNVHVMTNELQEILSIMRPHFSSQPGAYYSDSLFFISIGLYRIAPKEQEKVVMLDIDTIVKKDIIHLFEEFDNFNVSNVFGATPELTPVYHHVLYMYRYKHKSTLLGEPFSVGGFPGINSGVLMLHLENMRTSNLYQSMLTKEVIDNLSEKYFFKGHLGDQDFYTLISLEYPELMYLLDCGWNRQLCTWWREHGYRETFQAFAKCNSTIKLYHGNCNSNIPGR